MSKAPSLAFDIALPTGLILGRAAFERCLSEHVFGDVLRGVKKVADHDVVLFDREKDDVGFKAVAAITRTKMIHAKGNAGKKRKKLEGLDETGVVKAGLMPPEFNLRLAEDDAKLRRRGFA